MLFDYYPAYSFRLRAGSLSSSHGFSILPYRRSARLYSSDLTSDLLPAARQWSELKLRFDGIYSGFLGSLEQISKVSEIFDLLSGRDTLIFVDPCMADNGKLYQTYSSDMARGTQLLCHKADFILPNLTEACFLLNEPYRPERYRTREP